jgi:hypothetical protein
MPDIGNTEGGGMSESIFDRSALGHEAGKLLDALLDHVNEIGRAQVSSTALLKDTGLTQGALVRARSELLRSGVLRVEPGFSGSGLRGANVYVLNMTAIEPPSTTVPGDETGRTDADDSDAAAQPVSGEVPAPSGRHRQERGGLWRRFLGRSSSS